MSTHPRARELEGFAVGEGTAEVAEHIQACIRCREQVAELVHEREQLLARQPAPAFVARVATRRAGQERRVRRRRVAMITGLGVAAAASLALAQVQPPERPAGTRLKGVGVEVFRKRGEVVAPLGEHERVRAGDGLRLSLTLPSPERVSIWFVDRHGRIDRYPGQPELALAAGENVLPGAVVVDEPCVDMTIVVATPAGQFSRQLACE